MIVTLVIWVFFANGTHSVHALDMETTPVCQAAGTKLEAEIKDKDMTAKQVRWICIEQHPPATT